MAPRVATKWRKRVECCGHLCGIIEASLLGGVGRQWLHELFLIIGVSETSPQGIMANVTRSPFWLACFLTCQPACLPPCLLACLRCCLLAGLPACLCACGLACCRA
eukprot:9725053-Alexandrium_andersonii.AAC.1